jgi:hypothetical protein
MGYGFQGQGQFYELRAKYCSMGMPDAKRLPDLESENAQFKKLLAEGLFAAEN